MSRTINLERIFWFVINLLSKFISLYFSRFTLITASWVTTCHFTKLRKCYNQRHSQLEAGIWVQRFFNCPCSESLLKFWKIIVTKINSLQHLASSWGTDRSIYFLVGSICNQEQILEFCALYFVNNSRSLPNGCRIIYHKPFVNSLS